jgi:hypothetical protein
MQALPQDLADFLVTRNFDPEYFDAQGQPAEAGDAKTMKFDYIAGTGKNYGTAVIVVADDELNLFYGDNLGRGMEPEDKDEWFSFLEQLSNKAASHSATWSPRDINQLKHTLAGIAAIKEGLFEGYYGNRKVSYMGEQTQARLVINHNRTLGEDDKRYRYVESLFIETAEQERFRLPFKSLAGGRAMLEHVRSGGRPYDIRGNHISEVVSEMAVLSRFNRAQHNRVFEGVTQELVESARQYYHNLQETVKHLGSTRGYQAYFESWAPDQTGEAESLVENLRNMFVEQTLDARIEAALPTLAKIQQQGMNMKEAQIFENWINNLSEGTWALPETPEQMEKLNQLMSGELIVGPDATNATEQLYDIVGDDELFDILNDLADRSQGRANIWDDSDVQRRLAELGVQTPQSTQAEPADVAQDTAPEVKEQGMAEGDNRATFVEDAELAEMLKYAGVPVKEGVLNDDTRNTWDHLLDRFRHEVEQFKQGGDIDSDLYDAVFDYYDQHGAMPYRVRNAKDGTASQWISDRLADDLGIKENLISPMIMPVSEGSCNMTMEGQYCPEHGLMECGSMEEDGGAVGMPYSMGEEMDEAMFPGSAIGDKLRAAKDSIGRGAGEALKGAMIAAPGAGAGASAGAAMSAGASSALFAPALGAGALGGAAAALGGFLTYKGLNWLAQKLFGTKEEALQFANAHLEAASSGQPQFEFQGKTYPVKIKSPQEAQQLIYKIRNLQSQLGEDHVLDKPKHDDAINSNSAMTGSYYEGKETKTQEGDALLARIKSLALLR